MGEWLVCESSDFQTGWTVQLYPTSEIVCSLLGIQTQEILSYTILWKNTLAAKTVGENR